MRPFGTRFRVHPSGVTNIQIKLTMENIFGLIFSKYLFNQMKAVVGEQFMRYSAGSFFIGLKYGVVM